MRLTGYPAAGAPVGTDLFACTRADANGDAAFSQTWANMLAAVGIVPLAYARSTDATPIPITVDRLAASASNVVTVAASTKVRARGIVMVHDHASQAAASWDFSFLARRSGTAGSTSFAGTPSVTLTHTSGDSFIGNYALTFQADTSLDAVVPYFAGVAGRTTSVLLRYTSLERLGALAT